MKKNIFSLIVIFILVCLGSYLIYNYTTDDEEKSGGITVSFDMEINLMDKMAIEEYRVNDFVFKDVKVYVSEGNDSFEASVTSLVAVDVVKFEIIIYDEDNNVLDTIEYELKDLVENDERDLFCILEKDISKVSSFEIRIKND